MKSPSKKLCLMGLTLGVGLTFSARRFAGTDPGTQSANCSRKYWGNPQDQKIQQLQDKLEEIQKELMELKQANAVAAGDTSHHDSKGIRSTPLHFGVGDR